MHLLLFEALARLGCQFVEQLPDRAIIKIACVLRENLSGKNGNRLTMTWRVTSGIGVEHFSSGDHAGEKRRASCGTLPHPPVCCRDSLFETIEPPGRPIPGSKPESDLEFTSRPFRSRNKAEGVHRSWSPGWPGSPASGCTSGPVDHTSEVLISA